jgi:hypothetical protein
MAIALFSLGFFPRKANIDGIATFGDLPLVYSGKSGTGLGFEAEFDRLVFVLVDALRQYFVLFLTAVTLFMEQIRR